MEGTIEFEDVQDLAKFLLAFTGSTALFNVISIGNGRYKLTFTGGF
jgi:hypothetical protein